MRSRTSRALASSTLTRSPRASRFFLWNAGPDDMVLTAAEKGELDSDRGLQKVVDAMLASPRLEDGMRAFFDDMLGLR